MSIGPVFFRTIYDPACGTGGMLSESEKLILSQNERAELALLGQEYNDESWAICCSDMLIKDEDTANIVLGDTLGDGKTRDGFEGDRFHYLMGEPAFRRRMEGPEGGRRARAQDLGLFRAGSAPGFRPSMTARSSSYST